MEQSPKRVGKTCHGVAKARSQICMTMYVMGRCIGLKREMETICEFPLRPITMGCRLDSSAFKTYALSKDNWMLTNLVR